MNEFCIKDMLISDFTEKLASKEPVPGGGGASALAAALGAALGSMVANLTVGKKKYADVENEIIEQRDIADGLRAKLLELADDDAKAFYPLSQAYSLPTDTEEQRKHKDEVMEAALRTACGPPLDIMKCCADAIKMVGIMAQKGSVIAISDAAAGAALCSGAMRAASLNIYINSKYMKDSDWAENINKEADDLVEKYVPIADDIFNSVKKKLCAKAGG